MKTIPHYGVVRDDDHIAWLLQETGGSNALGLKAKSPFKTKVKGQCPHDIKLDGACRRSGQELNEIFRMSLDTDNGNVVRLFLPKPRGCPGVYFQSETPEVLEDFSILSRLSSPTAPIVVPMWAYLNRRELFEALKISNIQPLVVTGIRSGDIELMRTMANVARQTPRTLIFTGTASYIPQSLTHLSWSHPITNLSSMNLEGAGASILREWMLSGN